MQYSGCLPGSKHHQKMVAREINVFSIYYRRGQTKDKDSSHWREGDWNTMGTGMQHS